MFKVKNLWGIKSSWTFFALRFPIRDRMVIIIYILIVSCLTVLTLALRTKKLTMTTSSALNFFIFRKLDRVRMSVITYLWLLPIKLLYSFSSPLVTF